MDSSKTDPNGIYVYAATTGKCDLIFGSAEVMNELDLEIIVRNNPRKRKRLPFTLLHSWRVPDMATALSAIKLLQSAPPELIRGALSERAVSIETTLHRVLGAGATMHCPRCGILRKRFSFTTICKSCYQKEPRGQCSRCKQSSHHLSGERDICPRCAKIESQPMRSCARCEKTKRIADRERNFCKECVRYLKVSAKRPKHARIIKCSVCAKMRPATRTGRDICQMCARAEFAEYKECAGCGELARIRIKSRILCAQCAMNQSAPDLVRAFIRNFQSPHPGSQEAFEKLVQIIVPEDIRFYSRAARIIHFGKYLQNHGLPTPLTWSAIDEALGAVLPGNTGTHIRSCLLSLGHLLANEGRIESRTEHQLRCCLAERIANTPEDGRDVVGKFAQWSIGRKTTLRHVIAQVESVCKLWQWSEEKLLKSIFVLKGEHINRYMLETFWDKRCRCGALASHVPNGAAICGSCGLEGPFEKVRRRSPDTDRKARSGICMFFEWAEMEHLVSKNPVTISPSGPKKQIQHCSSDVLAAIVEYAKNCDNDPTDCLMLYLTTIHLFSSWELQMAEFPKSKSGSAEADLALSYGFLAPKRSPSLGRASTGRSMRRIAFPEDARSWMEPLLRRFQHQRSEFLDGGKSKFLFVASSRIQNNVPVSRSFLSDRAVQAAEKIVGFKIGLNLLKKTGGVFTVDTEGPQQVKQLGVGEKQAMRYRLLHRQLISLSSLK